MIYYIYYTIIIPTGYESVASFAETNFDSGLLGANYTFCVINCTGEEQTMSQCNTLDEHLEVKVYMFMKISCAGKSIFASLIILKMVH